MPLKEAKWKPDQTILKVLGYGDNKIIKVVHCNWLRTLGIEDDKENLVERGQANDAKLECNIARTKSKIFELAYCNPWDYFFTATLNKDKHDRTDLESFHAKLTQFLRNCKKKYLLDDSIQFLLIPELHKDGVSWHMHGFIKGLPFEVLKQFSVGDIMGKALAEKVLKGDLVYNWPDYQKSFGFCSLERVKNHQAVSKYITKYINKSLYTSVQELNAHLYYRSRNLKESMVIKKGTMLADIEPSFTHDYGWIAEFPYSDDLLEQLKNSFC